MTQVAPQVVSLTFQRVGNPGALEQVNKQTNRKPDHVMAGSTHVIKSRQGLIKLKSSGTDYQTKAAF